MLALTSQLPCHMSGFLQKQNFLHIMVRRYAVIKGTTLLFFKSEDCQKLDYSYQITPDVLIDIFDLPNNHRFTLRSISDTITCGVDDSEKLMRWILAIRGCTFNNSKISMNDFNILSVIGRGYYGKVMLCEKVSNKEIVAIKSIQKWKLVESKRIKTVLIERSILERVNFPFIVSFKYSFQTEEKFYLGIEYVPGGDLFNHLKLENGLKLDEVRFYIAEISLALNYLHQRQIIYRDLKTENVLIDSDGHIKLTDFGLSKICTQSSTFCGTSEFLPPEMVRHEIYDEKIDWWALGILAYELVYGTTPFYNQNRNKLFHNILTKPPYFPPNADPEFAHFVSFVLTKDPKKRPGFHEIRRTPFLASIDFEKLLKKEIKPLYVPNIPTKSSIINFDEEFTREIPNDSVVNQVVGRDDQHLPGFSFTDNTFGMFDVDSEHSYHSDDEPSVGLTNPKQAIALDTNLSIPCY